MRYRNQLPQIIRIACLLLSSPSLISAQTAVLHFANGDQLTVSTYSVEGNTLHFEHPLLGTMQLPADTVELVPLPPPEASPAPLETVSSRKPAAPETVPAAAALADSEELDTADERYWQAQFRKIQEHIQNFLPEPWRGRVGFAFRLHENKTTKSNLDLELQLERESDYDLYRFESFYNYGSQEFSTGEKEKTTDRYGVSLEYNRDLSERLFALSNSSWERNMINDVRHQVNQSFGIGYRIFDQDHLKLTVTPAFTEQYKDALGLEKRWYPLATFFNRFRYNINHSARVEQDLRVSVDPDDSARYQFTFNAALIFSLGEWVDLRMKYSRDYDALVDSDTPKNEARFTAGLDIPF